MFSTNQMISCIEHILVELKLTLPVTYKNQGILWEEGDRLRCYSCSSKDLFLRIIIMVAI